MELGYSIITHLLGTKVDKIDEDLNIYHLKGKNIHMTFCLLLLWRGSNGPVQLYVRSILNSKKAESIMSSFKRFVCTLPENFLNFSKYSHQHFHEQRFFCAWSDES